MGQDRSPHIAPEAAWLTGPRFLAVLIGFTLLGTALGVWLLGQVWPIHDDLTTARWIGGAAGFFSGLIGGGGALGALIIAGWWGTAAGIVLGCGFFATVVAVYTRENGVWPPDRVTPWMVVGVVLLAAGVVGFWIPGVIRNWVPRGQLAFFASPASLIAGIVMIALGVSGDAPVLLLAGVLFVAVWLVLAGVILVKFVRSRREPGRGSDET